MHGLEVTTPALTFMDTTRTRTVLTVLIHMIGPLMQSPSEFDFASLFRAVLNIVIGGFGGPICNSLLTFLMPCMNSKEVHSTHGWLICLFSLPFSDLIFRGGSSYASCSILTGTEFERGSSNHLLLSNRIFISF